MVSKGKGPGKLILRKIKVYHYALDPHTRKGSWMAERIGVSQQRISQILDELVEAGYLNEYMPREIPRRFQKGTNSLVLDMRELGITQGDPTLDSHKSQTSLPTEPSDVSYPEVAPRYLLFHHCSFIFKVGKVGDTEALQVKQPDGKKEMISFLNSGTLLNSGEWRRDGKIAINGRAVSVTMYHTDDKKQVFKNPRLQVYAPELYIPIYPDSDPELISAKTREKAESLCQEVVNFIAKHGHWSFGLIEDTNWKPHWAAVDERITGNIANQGTFYSKTKKVRTSGSSGRNELEVEGWSADSLKAGMKAAELPEAVLALEATIGKIPEQMEEVHAALGITSSQVEAIRTEVGTNNIQTKQIHARLDDLEGIILRMVDQSEKIARVNMAHIESIAALSGRNQQPDEGIYAKATTKSKWDIGYS